MKRLRYDRVISVIIVGLLLICGIYLMFHRASVKEYQGNVETYSAVYRQDDKVYSFDLKGFQKDHKTYFSLNDIYNVIVILDDQSHVYVDTKRHVFVYDTSQGEYRFDYGYQQIVYNNKCVELSDSNDYIYVLNKNYYLNVEFIEKILFNNEKKIKIENKNAIIS